MIRLALVGLGRWGKNYARLLPTLAHPSQTHLEWVAACDSDRAKLAGLPAAVLERSTSDYGELLARSDVDAVVLATPTALHRDHVRAALRAHKHVLVEKPLATHAVDADFLVQMAKRERRILAVGHLLNHHPGLGALGELLRSGYLGTLESIVCQRLGQSVSPDGAWWNLGPHDVALCRLLAGVAARSVAVRALDDAASPRRVSARLELGGVSAELQLAQDSPRKVRRTYLLGSKRVAMLDTQEPECVRVFEASAVTRGSFGDELTTSTDSCLVVPVPQIEPLRLQLQRFVEAIEVGTGPLHCDGEAGAEVVRLLEAGQFSLESQGRVQAVDSEAPDSQPPRASCRGGGRGSVRPVKRQLIGGAWG